MAKIRAANENETQKAYALMEKLLGACDDSENRPEISLTALSMAFYAACIAMNIEEKAAIDLVRTYWEYEDMPELLH